MTTAPTTAPVQPPDLAALLSSIQRTVMTQLNCAQPGIIQSVNYTRQTVEIKLAAKRVVGNETKDYPLLVDCPFVVWGGSAAVITMPIQAGDTCLVFFCDRSIDTWWKTGTTDKPSNGRAHSLADGIALVGIRSLANPVTDYSSTAVEIRYGSNKLTLDPDAASLSFGTTGGKITLDTQVGISNASTSLRIAIDALLDALVAFKDTANNTPNADTLALIAAVRVQFDALLK